MSELLKYAVIVLIFFAVQLIILFLTANRFRFLRLVEPILAGAAVVLIPLLCLFTAPPGWGILLFPLVIVICLALAGLALVGCGLAWLVYYLTKRKASDTP